MQPVRRMLVESSAVVAILGLGLLPYLGIASWSSTLALAAALATVLVGATLAWRSPWPLLPATLAGLLAAATLFIQFYRINRAVADFCTLAPCPAPQSAAASASSAFWPAFAILLLGLSAAIAMQARRGQGFRPRRHARSAQ